MYNSQHHPAPVAAVPLGPLPAAPAKARRMTRSHIMGEDQQADNNRARTKGVTLIEMLMALVIIAVLMAIAMPMIDDALNQARIGRAIGDVRALQTDLQTYETDGRGLPGSLSEIGRSDLMDPWGYAYRYLPFPDDGPGGKPPAGARKDRFLVPINSTFDVYSVGKDGNTTAALTARAAQDDIIRANDGGFIGLASKF